MVDGAAHPLVPGTACFLGYDVKHEIFNDGPDDLVMLWVDLAAWASRTSSRPSAARAQPGPPAPAPFERPRDVVGIERALGMNDTRR